MRLRYLFYMFIVSTLLGAVAEGQSSSVAITVQDLGGQLWNNGTLTYQLQPLAGFSGKYQWQGADLPSQYLSGQTIALNNIGAGAFSVPSNGAITPAGTQWLITVCPNATSPCITNPTPINGASVDISSQINAFLLALVISPTNVPLGYTDASMRLVLRTGAFYYNTILNQARIYTGSAWTALGGGGGSSGFPIVLCTTTIAASSSTTTLAGCNLTSATLTTPNLGTPTAINLANALGLPLTTGVVGVLPVANGGTGTSTPGLVAGTNITISGFWPNQTINSTGGAGGVTSVSNSNGTLTISPTTGAVVGSLNLSHANTWAAVQTFGTNISVGGVTPTGATGTGNLVFGTSPVFVTPTLGVPSSGTITNLTGTCTSCTAALAAALSTNGTANQVWQMDSGGSTQGWRTISAGSGNTTSTALTNNVVPKANGANSIINSGLSDDGTSLTYAGSGTANGWTLPEGTAVAGVAANDIFYPLASNHRWMMNLNNGGAQIVPGVTSAIAAGHVWLSAANGIDLVDGGAVIANIVVTLPTSSIGANTCTSPTTATMTGVATTSAFRTAFASNPNAVNGWGATGGLTFTAWPTSNTLNWSVCNQTGSAITPGAMNLNVGAQ